VPLKRDAPALLSPAAHRVPVSLRKAQQRAGGARP